MSTTDGNSHRAHGSNGSVFPGESIFCNPSSSQDSFDRWLEKGKGLKESARNLEGDVQTAQSEFTRWKGNLSIVSGRLAEVRGQLVSHAQNCPPGWESPGTDDTSSADDHSGMVSSRRL